MPVPENGTSLLYSLLSFSVYTNGLVRMADPKQKSFDRAPPGIYVATGSGSRRTRERSLKMAQCEVCGNEYDKAFRVTLPNNQPHVFDSFECAIHALAPTCEHCGVRIIGHGVEVSGSIYCCAHCASMAGASTAQDRV